MSSITNDGSDIIHQKLELKSIPNNMKSLENFEIAETAEWIKQNNFKKVGLQIPDELLPISFQIIRSLEVIVECEFGIMADTVDSSCCIDEVGGERYSVEAIVHYGHSCLTPTHRKLPVKYVFGSYPFSQTDIAKDTETITAHLNSQISDKTNQCITVLSDFRYIQYSENLSNALINSDFIIHKSFPNMPEYHRLSPDFHLSGSRLIAACGECDKIHKTVLFIGDNYDCSVKTTLIGLIHSHKNLLTFSPHRNTIENVSADILRFLRRRLYSIEVAKDAKRVGLLVGTLSIEKFLDMHDYLSEVMRKAGKIVYSVEASKINPQKLANFADLDVFVVINCPDSCLQFSDTNSGFYKPVVTPYEMVCACDPIRFSHPFSSRYLTDFRDLLTPEHRIVTISEGNERSEVSMISGKIVQCSIEETADNDGTCGTLIPRLDSDWSISAIDRSTRSWFGLDQQLGQTEVAKVKDGRSGIAAGYENEII